MKEHNAGMGRGLMMMSAGNSNGEGNPGRGRYEMVKAIISMMRRENPVLCTIIRWKTYTSRQKRKSLSGFCLFLSYFRYFLLFQKFLFCTYIPYCCWISLFMSASYINNLYIILLSFFLYSVILQRTVRTMRWEKDARRFCVGRKEIKPILNFIEICYYN